MVIASVEDLRVQIAATVEGDALEEVRDEIGAELADSWRGKIGLHDTVGASTQVNRYHSQRFIHRHKAMGGADNPGASAKGLIKSAPQADAYIFGGMMFINVEIAVSAHSKIKQAMPRPESQHMVKKPDSGLHINLSATVDGKSERDARLAGYALDSCATDVTRCAVDFAHC